VTLSELQRGIKVFLPDNLMEALKSKASNIILLVL